MAANDGHDGGGHRVEHRVTVNGAPCSLVGTDPATNALDWLRDQGLTGAKEGCAEGECGACSVMVARPDGDGGTRWTAVNACLVPAAALDGQEVVTAEGLGTPEALHPVQREMAVRGGSQCGYCTPGFVCSMAAEFYRPDRSPDRSPGRSPGRNPVPAASRNGDRPPAEGSGHDGGHDAHECGPNGFDLHALSGNLCRCTGYRPIRDAAYALGSPEEGDPFAARVREPAPAAAATRLTGASGTYARPGDLAEALALLAEHPDAVLVAGSTDWGVETNLRGSRAEFAIGIDRLPELRTLELGDDVVEIGAALSLSEVERGLAGRIPLLDQLFPQFASRLIRNGATIGGNLGTGSPIGDTPPALLALEADVVLASSGGERVVPLADYFTGYRQSVREPGELIRAVRVPLPLSGTTAFHKIAKRRFDDISSVAVGFALDVVDGVVAKARIGLGGVAATPIRALGTEGALEGRPWTRETARAAAAVMRTEGTPMDDHRASAAYRAATLGTALLKLHADTATPQEVGA
ncbi:xanthine dehydrogenase small subunit [Phycicoccus sp. Soil748]|uniref:xanthine dehydrogenase small subunit n=1 Tax=Phycicoccus sp. Soil748 TaxID=1736397 RepID=UPI0007028662|nr:FAD binding domain-containing protein [Phycicoccus sp. Soil748]KRE56548.1 xanthine dehydrogenase small subunit [Phycicoccus sp. Soil748]